MIDITQFKDELHRLVGDIIFEVHQSLLHDTPLEDGDVVTFVDDIVELYNRCTFE